MWPLLNLLRISALTLISLAIGSFFSDENGSSRTRKTYGKAIHLSIAKKPPRFHGRKRRLPSSEAGHVGLPAYKIALTYAPIGLPIGTLLDRPLTLAIWHVCGNAMESTLVDGRWWLIQLPLENGALPLSFLITKTCWPCHIDWRR